MHPYIDIFGHEISLYNSMYAIGAVGMLIICLLTAKKYGINKLKSLIYTVITFVFGVLGAKLMSVIYVAIMTSVSHGEYVPDSGVCLYGALFFLPVFMYILSLFVRERFRVLIDYMTPGVFLILAFSKIGCLLGGCCYGIADDNGVYNCNLTYKVFPVQVYESICTFIVVAILLILLYKAKKRPMGILYPIGMITYSIFRIIWENFRYYEHECEKHFFLNMTFWQCCSVLSIIIGAVWIVIVVKKFRECPDKEITFYGRLIPVLQTSYKRVSLQNAERMLASSQKRKEKTDKRISDSRKKHAEKAKEHENKAKELKQQKK